jgi:putative hemolysin
MNSVVVEILFVLILIIANGVFAMSEIAVVSARKARLQQWAEAGDTKARIALRLASDPGRFLATVQIGITLIGIFAGAFGGATIAEKLAAWLDQFPAIAPYSNALGLGIVVVIITYLSLVIGELAPKQLALNSPERIATNIAGPMRFLAKVTAPVVRLLSASTDTVVRLLGVRPSDEPLVTEEEIQLLIAQGTQAGAFEEAEQEMVERVFQLGDQEARELMTPRTQIVWLDLESSLEENLTTIIDSVYSRFPVCRDGLDNVVGIVQVKDLFTRSAIGESVELAQFLHQPLVIHESTKALRVLELFKQSTPHLALVVDEYGVVQGLVTLNDILEAIVGYIPSSDEPEEPQIIQRDDGSWLLDGMLDIDEFKELFELEELPDAERGGYQSLGGFIITWLGRIPTSGSHFEWNKLRFEVVDMDGNRVDKVLVSPQSSPTEDVSLPISEDEGLKPDQS